MQQQFQIVQLTVRLAFKSFKNIVGFTAYNAILYREFSLKYQERNKIRNFCIEKKKSLDIM